MPMYIFYPCLENGSPTSFEAFELGDDDAAREKAELVRESHVSATQVVVWRDDEALEPVRRDAPSEPAATERPSPGA